MALNDIKAFASLSSGLLARKGAAKPAMRPQGFSQMGASLEDLGWNDMGFEPPKPSAGGDARDADHDAFGEQVGEAPLRNPLAALTPSPVHGQQAEIAKRWAETQADDEEPEGEETDDEIADIAVPTGPIVPPAPCVVAADPPVEVPVPVLTIAPRLVPAPPVEDVHAPEPAIGVAADGPRETVARVSPAARAERASGPKAAFTLRLEPARHLRLRLAVALTGRSAQMLVTEAVDRLLADYPELETLAEQLPHGSRRSEG